MDKGTPTKYEPNQPITLAKTDIVEIDGQSVDVPVSVVFRLLPSPGVVIEADELPNIVLIKERFEIALGDGARLEAMVRAFNLGTGRGSLIPSFQPLNVIDKKVPLRSVQFSIFNYPEFYSNQMKWCSDEGTSRAIPHTKIEASDWRVEITGVMNISTVVETIKRERGYGITYNGVIIRLGEADFTVEEVERLLMALRTFLSFARGTSCSLALVEGKDHIGQRSWVRWGAHHVAPGNSRKLLFWRADGEDDIHSQLFPRFWCLFDSRDEWKKTILRTIDWYLQSNEVSPYVGLILTSAALERLSFQVLGRGTNGARTGEFIENALEKLDIESQLPNSCKSLKEVKNWKNGPHALTAVRNDLVHPNEKLGSLSHYVCHEAWNLGQWYIEMMLLRMLGYQGYYVNRLAGWREHDQEVLPVPWAKNP